MVKTNKVCNACGTKCNGLRCNDCEATVVARVKAEAFISREGLITDKADGGYVLRGADGAIILPYGGTYRTYNELCRAVAEGL